MTDDELELSILEKYVAQHEAAYTAGHPAGDKCARELDMREVLRDLTNEGGRKLDYLADLWLDRLAPPTPRASKGLLRRCSNSNLNTRTHKYHARAFKDPVNNPTPAWDRIRELEEKLSVQHPVALERELEQKFKILYSEPQEEKDFNAWRDEVGEETVQIGVLFVDIDNFKQLNERHTETLIDDTILPEAQKLLKRLAVIRGAAYRHGGEEFVVQLPNHNFEEVMAFAEKVRAAFEKYQFEVDGTHEALTVSIGVAMWPDHGESLNEVLTAANRAEHVAKHEGRNAVRSAI